MPRHADVDALLLRALLRERATALRWRYATIFTFESALLPHELMLAFILRV